MRALRCARLLGLPLRLHGIQLGRPVDLLIDQEELRAVGFDVLCGDGVHRFLPLSTAAIRDDDIVIRSPLVLLEEDELAFYRARTRRLTQLRGTQVEVNGVSAGTLGDVSIGPSGFLIELLLDDDGSEVAVPVDETVRFRPLSRSAA